MVKIVFFSYDQSRVTSSFFHVFKILFFENSFFLVFGMNNQFPFKQVLNCFDNTFYTKINDRYILYSQKVFKLRQNVIKNAFIIARKTLGTFWYGTLY